MKYGGLVLALVFLLSVRAASVDAGPAIEFTGVLVADGKTKIALTDRATGTTTWIESGGNFKGYTVTGYDAKADAITVKKDGREEQLRLVAAKANATTTVPAPPAPVAVAPVPATPTATVSPNANLALPANPATPTIVNVEAPPAPPPATVNVAVITPPPATPIGTSYTVQAGDSLNKISGTTGVSIDQLKLLNPDLNPNALLDTGQQIRIK